MSSLVKLTPQYKALGILPEDRDKITPTADNLGALVAARVTLISGAEEGKELSDSVKANQIVKFTPSVDINTSKYTILVGYNPSLAEFGAINCPSVLPPGEPISLVLRAYKNFSLDEFTDMYTFIIYALD